MEAADSGRRQVIEWMQSWARLYDLSLINFIICMTGAIACIWLTQCMTPISMSVPTWALVTMLAHRLLLLAIAAGFVLSGFTPYLEPGNYPWSGEILERFAVVVMLLIWPISSRARRLYSEH